MVTDAHRTIGRVAVEVKHHPPDIISSKEQWFVSVRTPDDTWTFLSAHDEQPYADLAAEIVADAIARAVADTEIVVMDRCAKLVCLGCRDGWATNADHAYHLTPAERRDSIGPMYPCRAVAIHRTR